jgi:hypothetical protein
MGRTRRFICYPAAGMTLLGLVAVVSPAHARPPLPLVPACDTTFEFPGRLVIKLDNGIQVHMDNAEGPTLQGATAGYSTPGSTEVTRGTVGGGVDGTTVDFTIDWTSGPGAGQHSHYTGVVNDNLTAQGMVTDNANNQNVWASAPAKLTCKRLPPEGPIAAPDTPPVGGGGAPPPPIVGGAAPTADVVSDVDVYKSVDPVTGGVDKLGVLRKGSKVQLMGSCAKDDWCQVSGAAVPTGQGWVWGALNV